MGLGVKHPFPTGDPLKEITGRNRADLHVFNIEGTILTDQPELINFASQGLDFATGYLVNPDGFTTYLDSFFDNIVPTQSKGHPYILHFDDYSQGNFDDGALVILEGAPEFTIEKWEIIVSAIFKCGIGGQGDEDNLFNNPIDVTVDAVDYVYVFDILSNGQPRIKVFDSQLQPVLGIGDSTLIPGEPISCDWDDYNDALHVLHSNGVAVIAK